jgi:hypothetical protein
VFKVVGVFCAFFSCAAICGSDDEIPINTSLLRILSFSVVSRRERIVGNRDCGTFAINHRDHDQPSALRQPS